MGNQDPYKVGVEEFDANFEFLVGDVCWEDHGGKWFRRVNDTCFQVVEIFNWESAVGELEAEGMPAYHVDLVEIDVSLDSSDAMESSGLHIDGEGNIVCSMGDIIAGHDEGDRKQIVICECMHGHGNKAHLGQWDGDDYTELFRLALEESEVYLDHGEAYEEKMESQVNAIGSTVREMQRGDVHSAMMRGIARGDESSRIMGIMYFGREGLEEIEKEMSEEK